MTSRIVVGLDLGSTTVKALASDDAGAELLIEQRATPWQHGPGGTTELTSADLVAVVRDLLGAVADQLPAAVGAPAARVESIAVSGMGETGFLVGPDDHVVAPAFAWFDPRGSEQVKDLPPALADEFAARTGLPLGAQVSVAKIAHLRDRGLPLAGLRWFNLPEFVAATLGGAQVSEYSLTSRTGLLDQDSGGPWTAMLDHLGVDGSFLPPLVDAGSDLGRADVDWLPRSMAGAQLTVAGHDHLVAAVAGGDLPIDGYHVSMGTAEVLLRVLDTPPSPAARARLAEHLINSVRHVVPGQYVLVAGVKTGLIMRRALQMCDITDRVGRDALDERVCALPSGGAVASGGIDVAGARNDDGVLSLTIRTDGASSAEIFRAILAHGNDEIRLLIEALDREVPPATTSKLTGGWAGMACVRAARAEVLPGLTVSGRSQDTAFGATRFALRALDSPVLAPIAGGRAGI